MFEEDSKKVIDWDELFQVIYQREDQLFLKIFAFVKNAYENENKDFRFCLTLCLEGDYNRVLRQMASLGKLDIVKQLTESGRCLINAAGEQTGNTALHCAAKEGHVTVCDYLIRQGAYLDYVNQLHFSPLVLAALSGEIDVIRCLINAGASTRPNNELGNFIPFSSKSRERVVIEQEKKIVMQLINDGEKEYRKRPSIKNSEEYSWIAKGKNISIVNSCFVNFHIPNITYSEVIRLAYTHRDFSPSVVTELIKYASEIPDFDPDTTVFIHATRECVANLVTFSRLVQQLSTLLNVQFELHAKNPPELINYVVGSDIECERYNTISELFKNSELRFAWQHYPETQHYKMIVMLNTDQQKEKLQMLVDSITPPMPSTNLRLK